MSRRLIYSVVFALALGTLFFLPAGAPPPFGLTVGATTCDDAMSRIHAWGFLGNRITGDGIGFVDNPELLYRGATTIFVGCTAGKVEAVVMKVDKGGAGNPAARKLYGNVARDHKLIAGGPIPTEGDGYALFESDGGQVELEVLRVNRDFTVTYGTKVQPVQGRSPASTEADKKTTAAAT